MSGLVAALLGLAVLMAQRASRAASRARARERSGMRDRPGPVRAQPDLTRWVLPLAAGGIGYAVGGVVLGVLVAGGLLAGRAIRRRRGVSALASRRDEQLADAMGAVVSAIRAGMSLPQALAYAAEESESPLRDELLGFVHDVDVGVPLADALRAWADRVGSEDARLVAAAMELHRRVGGDLPVVLAQVAETLRERVAVAREVRALTAQARLSGGILGALPIGFFAFLWLTSRSEMQASVSSPAGVVTIVVGLTLDGLAFLWIRRLLEVA